MRLEMIWRLSLGVALGAIVMLSGCGGDSIDREIGANSNAPPADAPKTPAEYDAKYPLPNAGNAAKGKSGGPRVTEP